MSRIIIDNRSSVDDYWAMYHALKVVQQGRISNDGKDYCYVTTFKSGVAVHAIRNKTSDRFVVMDYQRGDA